MGLKSKPRRRGFGNSSDSKLKDNTDNEKISKLEEFFDLQKTVTIDVNGQKTVTIDINGKKTVIIDEDDDDYIDSLL